MVQMKMHDGNDFMASFISTSYNPYDGPNDNPEVELPLTAGEYIYVYGDMDDDGFYEGMASFHVFESTASCFMSVGRCFTVALFRRANGRTERAGPL